MHLKLTFKISAIQSKDMTCVVQQSSASQSKDMTCVVQIVSQRMLFHSELMVFT